MKLFFTFILTILPAMAMASAVTCLPKQLAGSGTSAIARSNAKGDFIAYYCPREAMPTMFVCLKSTCSLVASKRAFAQILTNPSVVGVNAAIKPYTRDPLRDPELKQVWLPHIDEIAALGKQ